MIQQIKEEKKKEKKTLHFLVYKAILIQTVQALSFGSEHFAGHYALVKHLV